jgi:hypothetical protein
MQAISQMMQGVSLEDFRGRADSRERCQINGWHPDRLRATGGAPLILWTARCAAGHSARRPSSHRPCATLHRFTYDRRGRGQSGMPGNMRHRARWTISRR